MARIHIIVADELHRQAKFAALRQNLSLKDFVTQAIEAAVAAEAVSDAEKKPDKKRR